MQPEVLITHMGEVRYHEVGKCVSMLVHSPELYEHKSRFTNRPIRMTLTGCNIYRVGCDKNVSLNCCIYISVTLLSQTCSLVCYKL
jgi:hypothetical protein